MITDESTIIFKVDVTIISPDFTEKVNYNLHATFFYDDEASGKKTWLQIKHYRGEHFERYYDLRYDVYFDRFYLQR